MKSYAHRQPVSLLCLLYIIVYTFLSDDLRQLLQGIFGESALYLQV